VKNYQYTERTPVLIRSKTAITVSQFRRSVQTAQLNKN